MGLTEAPCLAFSSVNYLINTLCVHNYRLSAFGISGHLLFQYSVCSSMTCHSLLTMNPILLPLLIMKPVLSLILTIQLVRSSLLTLQPVLFPLMTIQPVRSSLLSMQQVLFSLMTKEQFLSPESPLLIIQLEFSLLYWLAI